MQSSVSATECAVCTVKTLSVSKLRRLNTICLTCLCILGLGTVTFSAFFIFKYRSLKRRLAELEARIDQMSDQFEMTSDATSSVNISPRPSIMSLISSSSSSDLLSSTEAGVNSMSTVIARLNKTPKHGILKKSVSFGSDMDSSGRYETPPSSPIHFYRGDFFAADSDDNKTLELIQNEDYVNLKRLASDKQDKYEMDPSSLKNTIYYIKTLYCLSEKEINPTIRKELEFQAYDLAKSCVEIHPNSYLSRKWLALTTSKVVEYFSINEKVRSAFDMKKQLDVAIDLNQDDYVLFYLRGRWSYKIHNLSWPERYAVKIIFGNIPDDCLEAAFNDFSRVELLNKDKSKGNLLHLAKCLIEKKRIPEAIEHLRTAFALPTKSKEHNLNNQEIQVLLNKYCKDS